MKYICLVCGYPNLDEQPFDGTRFFSTHEICPSCGFHYGYDDLNGTGEYPETSSERDIIRAYRQKWIHGGMKWWAKDEGGPDERRPENWNPKKQLENVPEDFG